MGIRNLNGANDGYRPFDISSALVQDWVANGSANNKGLVLKQIGEDVNNVLWFNSSAASSNRPKLMVTYEPPAPTQLTVSPIAAGITDETPRISAIADASLGSAQVTFEIQFSGTTIYSAQSSMVSGGTLATIQVPHGILRPGLTFEVRARSTTPAGVVSSWAPGYSFGVKNNNPQPQPAIVPAYMPVSRVITSAPSAAINFTAPIPPGYTLEQSGLTVAVRNPSGIIVGHYEPFVMDSASIEASATVALSGNQLQVSLTSPSGLTYPAAVSALYEEVQ